MALDVNRLSSTSSCRVKCVDFHSSETWMLVALHNGDVNIWNYETEATVSQIKVCDSPVRAARFVERRNWIVTGSDDNRIRVFDCNTLKEVYSHEAHGDFIRSIAIHPTEPLILTSGDDHLIKLWNWEQQWSCQQIFEGHSHYVMQIIFNPKDHNTFASASLDKTVKVWNINSNTPDATLEFNEAVVNCVEFLHHKDKSYLISGSDNGFIKIFDYQNQSCVRTLNGHDGNVTAIKFHPDLSIILSTSEDGALKIWNSETFDEKKSLNYKLGRAWAVELRKRNGDCIIGLGYDEGFIAINISAKLK